MQTATAMLMINIYLNDNIDFQSDHENDKGDESGCVFNVQQVTFLLPNKTCNLYSGEHVVNNVTGCLVD